jgi:hypothetical protein
LCFYGTRLTRELFRLELEEAVEKAAAWAESFVGQFAEYQAAHLPWLRK